MLFLLFNSHGAVSERKRKNRNSIPWRSWRLPNGNYLSSSTLSRLPRASFDRGKMRILFSYTSHFTSLPQHAVRMIHRWGILMHSVMGHLMLSDQLKWFLSSFKVQSLSAKALMCKAHKKLYANTRIFYCHFGRNRLRNVRLSFADWTDIQTFASFHQFWKRGK